MITTKNISDWIDRYLDAELTSEQQSVLLEELEKNSEWQELFRQEKILRKAINVYNVNRIQQQVKKDISSGKAYRSNWSSGSIWFIFSCIAIVVLYLLWNTYYTDKSHSPENKSQQNSVEKTDKGDAGLFPDSTADQKQRDTTKQKAIKTTDTFELNTTENPADSFYLPLEEKSSDDKSLLKDSTRENKTAVIQNSVNRNICEGISISFDYSLSEPCNGKDDGAIVLSGFRGGQGPYRQSLIDEHNKQVPFEFLSAGIYKILVKDNNGCESDKIIHLKEKQCEKDLELLFRPDFETQIQIPVASKSGNIKIYSQANEEIWSSGLQNGNEFVEWAGTDKHGNKVHPGVYAIIISYEDGIVKNGYITVY